MIGPAAKADWRSARGVDPLAWALSRTLTLSSGVERTDKSARLRMSSECSERRAVLAVAMTSGFFRLDSNAFDRGLVTRVELVSEVSCKIERRRDASDDAESSVEDDGLTRSASRRSARSTSSNVRSLTAVEMLRTARLTASSDGALQKSPPSAQAQKNALLPYTYLNEVRPSRSSTTFPLRTLICSSTSSTRPRTACAQTVSESIRRVGKRD